MILRRFTKHVTDQNWFAVGLDVIVVVVGIFLGLQVSDLNEDRKERIAAEAFLDKLAVDIRYVITNFEDKREQRMRAVAAGIIVISYLRGEVAFEDHAENIKRGIRSIVRTSNLPIHTGNIEIILLGQNYPKTNNLSLYARIDELIEDIKYSENVVNHIREQINLTIPVLNRYYADNEYMEGDFPALFDLEAMKNSTEFIYAIQSDVVSQNFNIRHYQSNIKRFEEMLALLHTRSK